MSIVAADEVVKPLKLFQELVFEIAGEAGENRFLNWLGYTWGIRWPVVKLIYRGRRAPTKLYMQSGCSRLHFTIYVNS